MRDSRVEQGGRLRRRACWLLVSLGLIGLLAGCGHGPPPEIGLGADGDYRRAREAYERGDHLSAIELLEAFERNHPGSQFIDDALFTLGMAHQGNKEYILARQALRRVRDEFPRSPHAEVALFEIGRCWYLSIRGPALDPEPAEEALRSFRVYLRRYPEGGFRAQAEEAIDGARDLLARKAFLNGETYMRLGRPAAARRYYERSLERWERSPVAGRALAGIAASYEREKEWAGAREAYQRLLGLLGTEPQRFEQGAQLARRAQEKLAALSPAEG